ncbi:tRNA (N(6)-L-threonylcarbamoyladenosine(37)-C(2))-methylthiotransferase MtaB [Syntrophomonas erecta]
MKKAAFHTLGCKVNQVETEQLKEDFIRRGYQIVDFSDQADIYIINTCTVTRVSDRKSRAVIRRAARKNPEAIIVVTGCLAEIDAAQIEKLNGVNLIIGNRDKSRIGELLGEKDSLVAGRAKIVHEPILSSDKLAPVFYERLHERTRAFVKIQDGCESFCSYCIVPYSRGPVRSKLPRDVIQEISQLVSLGYREIVLTGIHTGQYGKDLEGWYLERLLHEIFRQVDGDYRIRLSSVELNEITEGIIGLLSQEKRLCRHLHIPLQSGSTRILSLMARQYTAEDYYEKLQSIAKNIPAVALTADVMVGFPGEQEADFNNTRGLLEQLPMADLHVFKYSPRPGTPAADFPEQVDEKVKHHRSEILLKVAKHKREAFIKGLVGCNLAVLVERLTGENEYYGLSDNYIGILFKHSKNRCGDFQNIKLDRYYQGAAYGVLVN